MEKNGKGNEKRASSLATQEMNGHSNFIDGIKNEI